MTASETVQEYFDALAADDADRLAELMAPLPHLVNIGTDDGEWLFAQTHASVGAS